MPRKSPYNIVLSGEERERLESRARSYTSPYRDVVRAKAVLMAAEGIMNKEIAERLDMPRQIVSKWRKRFCEEGFAGLEERPRGCRQDAGATRRGSTPRV
ncbi:MAG: helix-turn-helix domain-containing protein [Actinobacteria bacterium]|nr:helix-turn-helix domain-containing protein [Actinomycetota bacterium]MCG2794330.1 helix-turn-helix domain-containing protein [Actinomycetes bacterium]